jgi:DNA modification methylase
VLFTLLQWWLKQESPCFSWGSIKSFYGIWAELWAAREKQLGIEIVAIPIYEKQKNQPVPGCKLLT